VFKSSFFLFNFQLEFADHGPELVGKEGEVLDRLDRFWASGFGSCSICREKFYSC
jgi:hypothetical protein